MNCKECNYMVLANINYIYEALQSIATEVTSDKLNELIQYVALYV